MSYRDHYIGPEPGIHPHEITHSWVEFTRARLSWLYGPDYAAARWAMTQRDLAAWKALGTGRAAA